MHRLLTLLLLALPALAQPPTGAEILARVDANQGSDNKIVVAEMTIHGRRGSRTIRSRSWIEGTGRSFTEYLAPAREQGIKMLKLEDELWTYTPDTDRTIKISGHMLRQSVMGSDLSYEDMMEDPDLAALYDAEVVGEDTLVGRPCWVLELTAREDEENIAYQTRRVWVDRERYTMMKEDRFAKTGKLLKTTEITEVERIQDRWVPTRVVFRDMLKAGNGTEFTIETIQFDAEIPAYIFTKAVLR